MGPGLIRKRIPRHIAILYMDRNGNNMHAYNIITAIIPALIISYTTLRIVPDLTRVYPGSNIVCFFFAYT